MEHQPGRHSDVPASTSLYACWRARYQFSPTAAARMATGSTTLMARVLALTLVVGGGGLGAALVGGAESPPCRVGATWRCECEFKLVPAWFGPQFSEKRLRVRSA